ncbi:MAG: ABC transporter substrate-binding protein [Patescibacteria group bacterium]
MEQTNNNGKWWVIGVIVLIVIVIFASRGGSKETGPIKIGFIGPLTGDAANIGQNAQAAVQIAVKEINDAGGIKGRPLEVIFEDGKCNGKDASDAANKLINIDKISAILGGACSGETSAFTSLAEQSKTTVLSYCSSVPALTNAGDYIFRNYPSDAFQGKFAADYIYNNLGKKSVAVMYVKSDWGNGIKDVFIDNYKKLGGIVLDEEGYDQTSRDLRSQLSKIKSDKPELIYFLGYTEASIPALTQAKALGITIPFFGGDAWDDGKIWSTVGSAGENAMYTVGATDANEAFKVKMKEKVGSDEFAVCSPTAYDGMNILAEVMQKVGSNSEAIKNELYKTVYTKGVSSKEIKFDANGDLVGANYSVKVIKAGKAELVK